MRAIAWVKALPLRAQLAVIGLAYVIVLAYAMAEEFVRYLAELRDPVASSGGMWAWGDEMLAWFLFFLFMVPTFFLLLLMRQYEDAYIKYAKVLFWFSVVSPVCIAVFMLPATAGVRNIADPLLWRNWRGPFVLILMAASRLLARAPVAKRLLTRACLIEGGALAIFVTLILFSGKHS